jgi:uncharacterized membrane protein YjgN (DUF898 family)
VPDKKRFNLGREIVAAVIGLSILVATLYMLVRTFNFSAYSFGDEASASARAMLAAYARQKEMVLYGLSLLGTVTGYYLGRVPAERAAERAYGEAETAKKRRDAIAVAAQTLAQQSQQILEPRRTMLSERDTTPADRESIIELRAAIAAVQQELVN